MHTLWLARLDHEQDGFAVAAIRAVRFIWSQLQYEHTFKQGKGVVDALIENPRQMVAVGSSEDLETLTRLVDEAAEYHGGAAEFVIDPESTEVEVEDAEEDAGVFSYEGCKTALVLLNMQAAPSAPMTAVMHALALARATADQDLYGEVVQILVDTFELPVSFESDEAQGPTIHIFGEGGPEQAG